MIDKSKLFQEAFELIRNPKTFTTGASARMKGRQRCPSTDKKAVAWCSLGALQKAVETPIDYQDKLEYNERINFSSELYGKLYREFNAGNSDEEQKSLITINDTYPHDFIVKAWETVGKTNGWLK